MPSSFHVVITLSSLLRQTFARPSLNNTTRASLFQQAVKRKSRANSSPAIGACNYLIYLGLNPVLAKRTPVTIDHLRPQNWMPTPQGSIHIPPARVSHPLPKIDEAERCSLAAAMGACSDEACLAWNYALTVSRTHSSMRLSSSALTSWLENSSESCWARSR